jgi:hypothetical protein
VVAPAGAGSSAAEVAQEALDQYRALFDSSRPDAAEDQPSGAEQG